MSWCSQFRALTKKSWILWYRFLCGSICEILFPMILMCIIVIVRQVVENEDYQAKSYLNTVGMSYYLDESVKTLVQNSQDASSMKLGLYPGNPFSSCVRYKRPLIAHLNSANTLTTTVLTSLMGSSGVFGQMTALGIMNFQLKGFDSEGAFEDYLTDKNYEKGGNLGICVGIFIEQTSSGYKVRLRYDDDNYQNLNGNTQQIPSTREDVVNKLLPVPDTDSYSQYMTSGFTYLQYLITKKLIETTNPGTSMTIGVVPMRTPDYTKDLFLSDSGEFLSFIMILCYLTPVFRIISFIVVEKEQKTREGMKMMGLKDSAYWASFFCYYLVILLVTALGLTFIIRSCVYENSNFLIMLLYFFLFGLSVFAFSVFISSFFNRARVASITGIMIYFATYLVVSLVQEHSVSEINKNLACLLPTVSVFLGSLSFVTYEAGKVGINFSNINDLTDNFRFSTTLYMFVVDFAVYFLLGLYFENILPSPTGVRKPFYFFLTKEFWTGEYQMDQDESSDKKLSEEAEFNLLHPSEKFQQEGEDLRAQERSNICLKIRKLNKRFDNKHAVKDFSVNMYKGQIFALLGPNGAGKTTTISMLTGLLPVSGGVASYSGLSIFEQMEKTREKLGVCPQHDVLFDRLTPREHLEVFAAFKGRSDTEKIKEDVDEILRETDLKDSENTLACNLSGGQMRKLSIGIAFIGDSDMIFLDEPTSGIDIAARKGVWTMLAKRKKDKVIILTTHYMEEAEELGDRIGIMAHGQLKCVGDPFFLKNTYNVGYNLICVRENGTVEEQEAIKDKVTAFLKDRIPSIRLRREAGKEITYFLPKHNAKHLKGFFSDLDNNLASLSLTSYGMTTSTLEEIFLQVAKEDIEENAKEGQKLTKKMQSLSMGMSINLPTSEIDKYTIANEPEPAFATVFCNHFYAILVKRWIITFRTWFTLVNEILVPIILILLGFVMTRFPTFFDGDCRFLGWYSYPTPQRIYINQNGINGGTADNFMSYFSSTFQPVKFTTSAIADIDKVAEIDNAVYANRFDEPTRYGSFYIKTIDNTAKNYEAIILINMYSQDAAGAYTGIFLQGLARYATLNNNLQLEFANHPMPLSYDTQSREQASKGSLVSNTIVIAFALVPASVISFIVKEREDNLKHQQVISGMSILAYWLSNSVMDIFKTLIPAGIGIALIYIFGVELPFAWLLLLIFAFTIIPFTYFTSFFFDKENAAQTFTLLLHFFAGVVLSPVFTIFHLFDSTRDVGKGLGWIFRIIPSFSLSYGITNISYKDLYATLENKETPDDLSMDCAGGDLLFLVIGFFLFTIFMILIENQLFDWLIKCFQPSENTELKSRTIPDDLVKREVERAKNIDISKNPPAVLVKNLKKIYRVSPTESILAVDNLTFAMDKGECLALLGTNGAGKSTTFKMLTNDVLPTSGEVYIKGLDLTSNFTEIRKSIGYGPQYESAFMAMTVRENLEYYSRLKGIPKDMQERIIAKLITDMNLTEFEFIPAGELSGGNKRKLSVAIALLGNPPIVFLDEVSTGIDPQAKRFMWHVIARTLKNKYTALILTTHSMEEAEYLCTSMAMMVAGNFCCIGTPQELKDTYGNGYEVQISLPLPNEEEEKTLLNSLNISENIEGFNKAEIITLFNTLGMGNLEKQLTKEGTASYMANELAAGKLIKPRTVANYLLLEIKGKIFGLELAKNFSEVKLVEHVSNFFKFRIKKTEDKHTIGYVFGIVQELVDVYNIDQYSASQTSLGQIFNTFARQAEYGQTIGQEEIINPNEPLPKSANLIIEVQT